MERWQQALDGEDSLARLRAKQMIDLTNEGTINTLVPELMLMVLGKITVHDLEHFTVSFLDGTEKEILV